MAGQAGGRGSCAPSFFEEGREPKTKFNRGLSTAAPCCSPLPNLNETWLPRYKQPQSPGLCLFSEGGMVAAWGSAHDDLSTGVGIGEFMTHLQKCLVSASVRVTIACAVLGLSMVGMREACKRGFSKEMTCWTSSRTIVS